MFDGLRKKFAALFGRGGGSEEVVKRAEVEEKILEILLEADVSLETAEKIVKRMEERVRAMGRKVGMNDLREALRSVVVEMLQGARPPVDIMEQAKKPYVILFLGINGTGKTTTIGKMAHLIKKSGRRVVIAAGDTFRAGAIEQIAILGEQVGVSVIKHSSGGDPAAVAYDAIEHAASRGIDFVLIDSAGRMQTNRNLMDEMKKIKRVAKPDLTLLVIDAVVGQDAVNQARAFAEAVGFDGVILTKLDTDARGGAVITVAEEVGKPIYYLGVGQGMDDLMPFDPVWYANRIVPSPE
ncbi:signal recognition particle-docking protein FtsY [Thermogymnomonas acidicola]|uniref:Signal recognition particle receptor FtsY n=1 Tax=Thermogymnomonas acidicola TaxID=399579 RepID=A0AA37BPP9_9ARCH|nr:signal recognition particle-docking protein FtsY [Thermogymnomonas acidicola]GGM66811.1 signal recognition particle-docking protein FtsY [Thermogymnomonas acidicola]